MSTHNIRFYEDNYLSIIIKYHYISTLSLLLMAHLRVTKAFMLIFNLQKIMKLLENDCRSSQSFDMNVYNILECCPFHLCVVSCVSVVNVYTTVQKLNQ